MPKVRHRAGIEEDPGLWSMLLPPSNKALWVAYSNLFICRGLTGLHPGMLHLGGPVTEAGFSKSIGEGLGVPVWVSLANICMASEPLILGRTLMLQGL